MKIERVGVVNCHTNLLEMGGVPKKQQGLFHKIQNITQRLSQLQKTTLNCGSYNPESQHSLSKRSTYSFDEFINIFS